MSVDPSVVEVGEGSFLPPYSYVGSSPLGAIDSAGHFGEQIVAKQVAEFRRKVIVSKKLRKVLSAAKKNVARRKAGRSYRACLKNPNHLIALMRGKNSYVGSDYRQQRLLYGPWGERIARGTRVFQARTFYDRHGMNPGIVRKDPRDPRRWGYKDWSKYLDSGYKRPGDFSNSNKIPKYRGGGLTRGFQNTMRGPGKYMSSRWKTASLKGRVSFFYLNVGDIHNYLVVPQPGKPGKFAIIDQYQVVENQSAKQVTNFFQKAIEGKTAALRGRHKPHQPYVYVTEVDATPTY
jgi:hypothetical protein